MAGTEQEENATPMDKMPPGESVRERKAVGKSNSDDSVIFSMRQSIQEQDTSGPGFLYRGLKQLEKLHDDYA
jgi:hypothetical protein